jgi:hypothetical protein
MHYDNHSRSLCCLQRASQKHAQSQTAFHIAAEADYNKNL